MSGMDNRGLVKICGLKTIEEAGWVSEAGADFAGVVVFFPKSKRNMAIEDARKIIAALAPKTRSVAVTVTPSIEQIREIEGAGFDYLQFHGELSDELLAQINIPIIKAFNVKDVSDFDRFKDSPKVAGFVFDANNPGSGKDFDYKILEAIDFSEGDDKFVLLAGGLGPENVAHALEVTGFTCADTSSGVENETGDGKSREKIFDFVKAVISR